MIGTDSDLYAMGKVKIIIARVKTAQIHKKSYADWVFLKVSPMKGVMRFRMKGKLSPRYVDPYKILKMVGKVAYELELLA